MGRGAAAHLGRRGGLLVGGHLGPDHRDVRLFTVASWKQDESLVAQAGGCSYDGSDGIAALGEYRWLPGCPLGSMVGFSEVRNPAGPPGPTVRGGAHTLVGFRKGADRGTYGLGVWVQAQNVRDTAGFAYWIGH